ncbi:hypothetical protein JRQ81_000248 [Phrynocephalus forsythii]|uniref:Sodium/hydrogen exchanger 10 n=1 Tax=Phrynocephalus forsythii TaxID=171643 RepID=A0A9Q1B6U5_9SAUR|nr:hypothetical protein JRQ81_000248 [Phrynocephalus forsythii]
MVLIFNVSHSSENGEIVGFGDQNKGTVYIFNENLPAILLLLSASCTIAALLRTIIRETKIPILVVMFFLGVIVGIIAHVMPQLLFVKTIADISPIFFQHLVTPIIIFTATFKMDFYIFRKLFWQVLIISVLGCLMNCALLGWLTFKFNKYNWTWNDSMLFSLPLSTTDAVLSAASLKNIGLSKILINFIQGEALFNDATATIIFELYRELVNQSHGKLVLQILAKLILKFFGSAVFGFMSSRIVKYWLTNVFNDGITIMILSLSMVYIIYFVAEWVGMSGIIALFIVGLLLDSISFSKGMDTILYNFWSMLTFLAHSMIYYILGIVIAQKTYPYINSRVFFYIIPVYLFLNLVRALVVLLLSPLLSRFGYGFNWRWGAVTVWSGIRGSVTLTMALRISYTPSTNAPEIQMMTVILLHSVTASLLTLMINSTTVKKLVMTLGLSNVTLPKRVAFHNAFQRIKQMEANAFAMLKLDKFLAGANWAMAEDVISVDDPNKLNPEEVQQLLQQFRCPECNADVTFETNAQQIADMMEEARLRLLTAQIASYQKQYNSGILSQEATQTLIGAAESYTDVKGKFMNIQEVKTYWENTGILVMMKNYLSDWVYKVKGEKSKRPKNKILKLCHQVVFLDEFEYISSLITYLNCTPIVLHFIPSWSLEYFLQLRMCNYFFLSLYIIEAAFKVSAMGITYTHYHWNRFDILVIIVGIADVIIMNIFKTADSSYPALSTIRIFRFIRVLRMFRLLKLVIPKMIMLLDAQINKQFTFRYYITKGYVQGEEDIQCLIGQIAGHEKVYTEIKRILEKNKQDAMKELGLMQRDYPEIVTAVKTKQAAQTVFNTASETLQSMLSGGIVVKNEGSELNKILLVKRKRLGLIPPTISPPTIPELLNNVMWLHGNKKQIEYIQEKAKMCYYDYEDLISDEGDLPKGIHFIVSGVVKLSGSPPLYGVDSREAERNALPSSFTDYLVAGAIIGEVNCLTKQEMEYAVTCETAVQTCFISKDDLLEAFDKFVEHPTLEYKIWLKIALDSALKTFTETLPNQDWLYKICTQYSNMRVKDVPKRTKCDIYNESMDDVILVHGSVQDCQQGLLYCAPCILPKTCHQVQGMTSLTKLLIIKSKERTDRRNTEECSVFCRQHSIRRSGEQLYGNLHSR